MTIRILNEDCLAALPRLAAEGFMAHSCVTDPPYAIKFMGKRWDDDIALRSETWRLVFDCLLPGGYLLAFGGTRTWHRQAVAIEDAGFEIRDTIMWLYGSGFPKSLDVGKAIDKSRRRDFVLAARDMGVSLPGRSVDDWTKEGHAPGDKWWGEFKAALPEDTWSEIERRLIGKSTNGIAGGSGELVIGNAKSAGFKAEFDITAPATEAARQWQGWGTALKPAVEPIVLARKPLIGTVAANVLAHGTGAINIDASRIHGADAPGGEYTVRRLKPGATLDKTGGNWRPEDGPEYNGTMKPGRWPANVIHDGSDEVEAAFAAFGEAPGQSGRSSDAQRSRANCYGATSDGGKEYIPRGDAGTASRFFYTSKADAADRAGSRHPTVKPTDLMRYLVRLVTPLGGTVLDPFAGSGSTGLAADQLGCNAVLIERDPAYATDIERKIAGDCPLFTAIHKSSASPADDAAPPGGLFS